MARQHPLTCKQVKAALAELGFEPRPRTGTSHEKWVKTTEKGRWIVTVDCPKAPFSNDLIKSMEHGVHRHRIGCSAESPREPGALPNEVINVADHLN